MAERASPDFHRDLAFSLDPKWRTFWFEVYERGIPGFETMEGITDLGQQRLGVDRLLRLKNGKSLTVDEKLRRVYYPDILLEIWSDNRRGVPGWIQKELYCDFIGYGFPGIGLGYLFPFHQLQGAFQAHSDEWVGKYGTTQSKNSRYTTESVAVPTAVLFEALDGAMRIDLKLRRSVGEPYCCCKCGDSAMSVNLFGYCAVCELLPWERQVMSGKAGFGKVR